MASKTADCAKVCLVCFETRPLKIAGRCKHSFCTECLTTAIESKSTDDEFYKCPTCQADCPRPWDGVKGLVDFTGEEVAVEDLGSMVEQEGKDKVVNIPEREIRNQHRELHLDVRCMICHHKKREVQAVNLCVECKNLHICGDCTEVHARNKATRGHAVIPFRPERPKQEAVCEEHNSSLDSYCIECKQAVCVVCVMLEHGDHTLEKIGELVDNKVEGLKVILEEKEKRMKKLQNLAMELAFLRRIVPIVDKQDILIKEIEDHAQKCIDKIIKWKEDLKEQVRVDYQIICDIPECLKKVSEVIQKMREPIQRAGGLLAETEHQVVYLDRLTALQEDLEALAETGDNVQGDGYIDQLQELHNQDCRFTPDTIDFLLGKMEKTEQAEFKQIYWRETIREDPKMFIPCVANLGQRFAIAHPTIGEEPSNAADIYEFPGKLIHTFRDHVPPLYDMSATPDGNLAVLSDGTEGISRCVKLFDSDTGYISSTRDFDIAKPLSLGVTLQHQYIILGDNKQEERQITVVDRDGRVEHTHVIKEKIEDKRIHPRRITCGGRFIFVMGELGCFAYVIRDTGIQGINECVSFVEPIQRADVSANVWDDLSITCTSKINGYKLNNWEKDKEEWCWSRGWSATHLNKSGRRAGMETRVSRRGSHIVRSIDHTFFVYKLTKKLQLL